jgi:tRNA threonylcarbamoyladenosine biosynthesis protein TsaE
LKEKCITQHSVSDRETINLGQKIGTLLVAGDVVGLVGELGSGKTWFAKGLALGLGVSPNTIITSPSFTLINEYEGRYKFFHMDVYRLESLSDLLSAGLDEYFYKDGVVAMEWADRWPEILPSWWLKVELIIIDDISREIILSSSHPRVFETLKKAVETESYVPEG